MTEGSIIQKLKDSLTASGGEIVFGMEDGTVSILGLVLGVTAGASSGDAVVLAGATGAIAASVSMMAGCFLELESQTDEARIEVLEREEEIRKDPTGSIQVFISQISGTGLSPATIETIRKDLEGNPLLISPIEQAVSSDMATAEQKTSPVIHSFWMFISDLCAGLTPVIPFVFLPIETAWIVCIVITSLLLILLGIGRARLGNRNLFRTVLETIGIALAAALAGILVGQLLS